MFNSLLKTADYIDAFNERVGRIVAWLTFSMVGTTFLVVVLRYGFDTGWIAMQESVTYMHAVVFMAGAAYTFKHDGHVRVDIFYRKLTPLAQHWINLFGALLLLLPVSGYILFASWDYVYTSWKLVESSREAGGLPLVFMLKSCILLLPALLILQGIAQLCRNLHAILHTPPAEDFQH